jgi:hypothetical protein
MERQNTSRLFLLPALALGLIVAWTGYAGSETSIENMSYSIGAGSWINTGDHCYTDETWTCPSKDGTGYNCTVEATKAKWKDCYNDKPRWSYSGFCEDGDDYNCEEGYSASACQEDEPDDPSP